MDKLDKAKYLNRVIIASWIGLALCFIIKIFGGNLFEIACANENFIAVCDYADTNYWANYLINCAHCFISLYFFTLAIISRYKFETWQLIILVVSILALTPLKILNSPLSFIADIWEGILLPILFLGKRFKEYWKPLFANVILIVFQVISLVTKNLSIGNVTENGLLIGIIYSIDVTLMVILYYLYSNEVRRKKNGSIISLVSKGQRSRT